MGLTLYNARVIRGSMDREHGSRTKYENKHRNEVGNSREMGGVGRAGNREDMPPSDPCEFKMTGITIVNQLGNWRRLTNDGKVSFSRRPVTEDTTIVHHTCMVTLFTAPWWLQNICQKLWTTWDKGTIPSHDTHAKNCCFYSERSLSRPRESRWLCIIKTFENYMQC